MRGSAGDDSAGGGATTACDGQAPPALLAGIDLFNRGDYYECHEVLEDLWRAEVRPVRALYQGILQIGVALHHLRRGNWRGAVKLLTAGIEKVARFQPRCLGVDTAALLAAACDCLEQLQVLGPDGTDAFDWSLVPRIEVATGRAG